MFKVLRCSTLLKIIAFLIWRNLQRIKSAIDTTSSDSVRYNLSLKLFSCSYLYFVQNLSLPEQVLCLYVGEILGWDGVDAYYQAAKTQVTISHYLLVLNKFLSRIHGHVHITAAVGNPDPQDSYVFGPSETGPVIIFYGSGSRSLHQQAIKVRKPQISTVGDIFLTFYL